nr:MAG TPA: hypothetical protein [Caudoviricetes sp.]
MSVSLHTNLVVAIVFPYIEICSVSYPSTDNP